MFTGEQIRGAEKSLAKQMVFANIINDDKWLARALLALYSRQTSDEQAARETKHQNNRGFNSADATILSSYAIAAKQWMAGVSLYAAPLSPKQKVVAIRLLRKYTGQLVRIAKEKVQ